MHKSELKIVDSQNLLSKTDDGKTALHLAAALGTSKKYLVALVEAVSVNDRDQNGQTPLHIAAQYGTLETVQRLLELSADPCVADIFGRTPEEVVDIMVNTLPGKGEFYVSKTAPNDFFDNSLSEYLRSLDMESFASWVLAQHEKARLLNSARHEYQGKPDQQHTSPAKELFYIANDSSLNSLQH